MKKFIGFLALVVLASCSTPEITINGPAEGQTYATGAYILIDVNVKDPDGVARVSYKIFNNPYDIYPPGNPSSYVLNASQTMQTFESGHPVEIYIEAEDANGHIGSKTVTVKHN